MTVAVDAVVYYRVSNATISVCNVEDAARSTRLLAQTTLRTVLGTKNLSEILSDRENISHFMQVLSVPAPTRHCLYLSQLNVLLKPKHRSAPITHVRLRKPSWTCDNV